MNASLQDYLPQTTNTQFSSRPRSLCEEFHTLSPLLPSIYLLSFPLHIFQFWSFPNICVFISWVLQKNPVTFSHLHYLCLVFKKSTLFPKVEYYSSWSNQEEVLSREKVGRPVSFPAVFLGGHSGLLRFPTSCPGWNHSSRMMFCSSFHSEIHAASIQHMPFASSQYRTFHYLKLNDVVLLSFLTFIMLNIKWRK